MIDRKRLDEFRGEVGAEALRDIVAAFLEEAGEGVAALAGTVSDGPCAERARILHMLKGSARNLAAVALGDLCQSLERADAFAEADLRRVEAGLRAARDGFAAAGLAPGRAPSARPDQPRAATTGRITRGVKYIGNW